MKIGQVDNKPAAQPTPGERKNLPAAVGGAAAPEPSAKVALSAAASVLSAAAADPIFDTAKVDRIAQAIRDGKFKPDAEAIANKLITNAEELLGRKLS